VLSPVLTLVLTPVLSSLLRTVLTPVLSFLSSDPLSVGCVSELQSLTDRGELAADAKVLIPCGQLSLETVAKRLTEAGF